MKKLSLLGATGSIGCNVLNVVRTFPEKFQIVGMAAGKNLALFVQQILEFRPEIISVVDDVHARQLAALLPVPFRERIVFGANAACQVASYDKADFVVSAIVGAAGLLPTLAALDAGKDLGLANKESLVMAGGLVMEKARAKNIAVLPIDSEHSAIFQSLHAGKKEQVRKLILTASGGPFYGRDRDFLRSVTVEQALAHPNWSMGKKISIDSATLMNKGLEIIEARWLFDMDANHIDVCVHPQSVVHSLVEYQDGAVIAQLGLPDMQVPIAYALSYPDRFPLNLPSLSLAQCGTLTFSEPDFAAFPALRLAYDALKEGGIAPVVLNAANEVAVSAFLAGRISFLQIPEMVERTLEAIPCIHHVDLSCIMEADAKARCVARHLLDSKG